jgi:hypothetical protein
LEEMTETSNLLLSFQSHDILLDNHEIQKTDVVFDKKKMERWKQKKKQKRKKGRK